MGKELNNAHQICKNLRQLSKFEGCLFVFGKYVKFIEEGKMIKRSLVLILIVSLLSGCATPPGKISAIYVSPLQYSGLSCEQIQQEMVRVSAKVREVAGIQQSEANKDAFALTFGLILFWPALFFMMGQDKKQELGRLKGEYEALEQAAIRNNCGFIDDLEKAREEQKKKHGKEK